jgi:hypothetical protein
MKNISTKFKTIFAATAIYSLPLLTIAATDNKNKIQSPTKFTDLAQVVSAVVGVVQILLIMATVLYLLYAGLMFVTARGDSNKISQARDALLWGMVGAALVLSAQVLVKTIQSGVTNILN